MVGGIVAHRRGSWDDHNPDEFIGFAVLLVAW